jgi:hypothetical protein
MRSVLLERQLGNRRRSRWVVHPLNEAGYGRSSYRSM